MRGNLFDCVFESGDSIELLVDFGDCPAGLCWIGWAYESYRPGETSKLKTCAPSVYAVLGFLERKYALVPVANFAGFIPLDDFDHELQPRKD